MTDLDITTTLLSIDEVGAFDLISREAMLQGFMQVDGGDSALPFVRQFCSSPLMCWWTDDMGEQGDPLMPALCACGQHCALVHVSEDLLDSERLFAFMDDIYVSSTPDRTEALHQSLDRQMWDHARIRLHQGKTQWNSGVAPEGWDRLTAAARTSDPSGVVWKSLPASEQGLKILGTPLGIQNTCTTNSVGPVWTTDCCWNAFQQCRIFNQRGCCSFCAGTRANCLLLRAIPPQL